MEQSPWKAYFGQMHKNSSSQKEPARHPVVVALTIISLISIIVAAFFLRFNQNYYGEVSKLSLCEESGYNLTYGHTVLPINEPLAYSLSLALPPLIVLCIELVYLIISFDESDKSDGEEDDTRPRLAKGLYLFFFRFLHFIAALVLTTAFVSVFVDVTKITFDWPRPYFLTKFPSNCDSSYVENNSKNTISIEEIKARLGFPSHRIALLSAAAVLLSVHSIRTLRAMRSSGPFQAFIVLMSVLAPLLAAASVLNSRENRPEDVVVGGLIGVISAAYMTSMLPTRLVWPDSETETLKSTPTTIEELNSMVPMRQPISYNLPGSPGLRRTTSVMQRHGVLSTNQPVALPGLTREQGSLGLTTPRNGLTRIN